MSALVCVCLAPFVLSLIMVLLLLIAGNILAGAFYVAEFFSELPDKIKQRKQTKEKRK